MEIFLSSLFRNLMGLSFSLPKIPKDCRAEVISAVAFAIVEAAVAAVIDSSK